MASQKSQEGVSWHMGSLRAASASIYLWRQVRQGGVGKQGSVREWCLIYDASNDGANWQGGHA